MSIYLGVDGGGTKTALCLISEDGDILALMDAPSCYYLGAGSTGGVSLVTRVLAEAIPALCSTAGITPSQIAFALFGLPAYGEVSTDLPLLDAAGRTALGHGRYRCDNDMVCGWAGSFALEDGINVISGTGSMTYGQRAERRVRVGGWGELFGDEGSGYWIAARGLQAFSQMSDGRLQAGPLFDVLREHLDLCSDLDLVDVVLNRWRGSRRDIAALCRQVVEAAQRGDTVAAQILTDAAAELVQLIETTCRRLGFADEEPVPVSYSGGVLSAPEVLSKFEQRLTGADGRYDLRTSLFAPVIGAALYAAKLAGKQLTPTALERLQETVPRAAPGKDGARSGPGVAAGE